MFTSNLKPKMNTFCYLDYTKNKTKLHVFWSLLKNVFSIFIFI